ncbi:hypothetical protein [Hyphomonas sp.]|uniref:hypothetical protein n=1 Tax=Hyphomonas sp. TaxID=87 RepID=UPI0032EFFB1B
MPKDKKPQLRVDFDPSKTRAIVTTGIRRATAFLSLALHDLDSRNDVRFIVEAPMKYVFWPDEIPDETLAQVRSEFRAWAIGSCFRELEQFYGRFLDDVGKIIELAEAHGKAVKVGTNFGKKYRDNTNSASKQKTICEIIGSDDHFYELNSISLARNCMTHNLGHVRQPRDCNTDAQDALVLKWFAMDLVMTRGGEDRVLDGPMNVSDLPGEGAAAVVIKAVTREVRFEPGQRVDLSGQQLSEICFFFAALADKTMSGLMGYLGAKKIPIGPRAI